MLKAISGRRAGGCAMLLLAANLIVSFVGNETGGVLSSNWHVPLIESDYLLKGAGIFCVTGTDCSIATTPACPTWGAMPGAYNCPTPGGGCTGLGICHDAAGTMNKYGCIASCWPFSNPVCTPVINGGAAACMMKTEICRLGKCQYADLMKLGTCGSDDSCSG